MSHSSRGRHGAPSTHRWLGRRSRPACGPIPVPVRPQHEIEPLVDEAPVLPSMEMPEDHMRQRPYDTIVLDVAVVTVPGAAIGYWAPPSAPVRTLEDYRVGDEVTVIAEDDPHTGSKAWVEALAPYKRSRQVGVRVLTQAGGLARLVEWYDVTELEPDPRADGDTLTIPAVDEDDMVLMDGAR